MFDFYHVPGLDEVGNNPQQVFYGTVGAVVRFPWFKPRGKSMCHIFMLGGGAGGGAGFAGAASAAGGGGGGGSSNQLSLTLPLWAMPDTLLLSVGNGGLGSNTGAGGAGNPSQIINPNSQITIIGSASTAGGGAAGAATGAATAGGLMAAVTISNSLLAMLSSVLPTSVNLAGSAGGAGGTATTASAGSASTYTNTGICVSGGGGGGAIGTTSSGGNGGGNGSLSQFDFAGLRVGQSSAAAGGDGSAGICWPYGSNRRMANSGGTGGAGSAFNSATSGGNGGDGGWGSGGGGGGAVLTGGVRGRGGNGGPGLIIITCW